jgi:ubiquinone/menaquinone biosynthesis C-methylase UbiE
MTSAAPRDFYDSQYHFEEDASRPDEKRIWHALKRLEPLNGSTILDLGCGAGWATRMATRDGKAARAVGLDFSITGLKLARGHTREILWLQADGTALPLADGSFDRLFCNGALEHFPDVKRGIREIARILRPDARAVIIVPNFYVKTEQPMEFAASYWNWKKQFEAAGLMVEQTATDWGPPVFKNANLKRAAARLVGKILSAIPYLQYQFIFVLRKKSYAS